MDASALAQVRAIVLNYAATCGVPQPALTGRVPAPASIAEAARQAGHSRVTRFRAAYRSRYGRNPALPGHAAAAGPATARGT